MRKWKVRTARTAICAALGITVCAVPLRAAVQYSDLGTVGGHISWAAGINNAGQVAGYATTSGDATAHAFLYGSGGMSDLGTLGGKVDYSLAYGINSAGLVVGGSNTGPGPYHAFMYSNGTMSDLGTLGGGDSSAYAINNAGQVVGVARTTANAAQHAFSYTIGGGMRDLGTLGGLFSWAYGVNNAGQVVGQASTIGGAEHAFLYSNGSMSDLGGLGGTYSTAYGINGTGQIVGDADDSLGVLHAVLWDAQHVTQLSTLAGGNLSQAYAINSYGEIVGRSDVAASGGYNHAVVWYHGGMVDLNNVVDPSVFGAGWVLTEARGINDNGDIVGLAQNIYTGNSHAFELSGVAMPVPEPASAILALGGLALLVRKRHRFSK